MLKYFIAFVGCLFSQLAFGQITTSAIKGQVKNEIQEMLSGASIQLTHEPTGVKYGAISREDGRFNLSNLRVGGPYRLEVSFVGFENRVIEGIVLKLGEEKDFNLVLTNAVIEIEDLVFIEGVEDFDRNKTGARQIIDNATLRKIPTISRSTADIYKLSPSASGNSFAGRNDQFNNFSLDGSIFNNPFGLDAAAPGGQANAQPISLDAIDQIQVSLAPYDVTMSGFTGASVNAVTKSGTNEVKGTVFGFYRNQDLTGKKVRGEEIFIPNLSQIQTGFSVGGPIIKDKLFYFANFELERREDLGSNFIASGSAGAAENISRVSVPDLNAVSAILEQRYGYQTGAYEGYTHDTNNEKGLLKFDWNVNQKHNVTLTYNFLNAFREQNAHPSALGRRGPDATTLQFFNSGYRINNKINSGILEVNSMLNAKASNKLQIGYTSFEDSRDPFSSPFPVININQNGSRYIVA